MMQLGLDSIIKFIPKNLSDFYINKFIEFDIS